MSNSNLNDVICNTNAKVFSPIFGEVTDVAYYVSIFKDYDKKYSFV